MLGHLRSHRTTKLQIFTSWSLSVPTDSIGYHMILRVFGGGITHAISYDYRITSRLDLGDNRKVITDYRNHGIERILTDLVASSGYRP